MGESFKAVCSLLLIIVLIVGAFSWVDDRPDSTTWMMRFGSVATALALIAFLVKLQLRRDRARDFLHEMFGSYFNRDGFAFAITAEASEGVCYICAYYQNQRDAPLRGQIAVRPAKGFFLTRAKVDLLAFEMDCGPGEFGVVRLPTPIPEKLQGKTQAFEVGASVNYPEGKGLRLRFRDGIFIRSNSKFGSTFRTAAAVAAAAGGMIVLSRPATVKVVLPIDVATEPVDAIQPNRETFWICGAAAEPTSASLAQ